MSITKVIAIDHQYVKRVSQEHNLRNFPVKEFREYIASGHGVDLLETLIPYIRFPPRDDTPESLATDYANQQRVTHALQEAGALVIDAPAKRTPDGSIKHSDDQHLMIAILSTCLRLRPKFLTFVAADGDYAPLLWELRREGIRTEVVATPETIANDLRRAAWSVIDLSLILTALRPHG